MRVKFTIPGVIRGKGRLRTRLIKAKDGRQFVHGYTPPQTQHAEALVRHFAYEAMKDKPVFEGPVALTVTIFKQPTASWSKKKKALSFFVTGKPDTDNIAKLVGDSLNKIVFGDDAQVALLHVARYYWNGPEQTDIEITDELTYPGTIVTDGVMTASPAMSADPLPLFRRLGRRRKVA